MKRIREAAIDAFIEHSGGSPARKNIKLEADSVAGPLGPLEALQGEPKARYTRALLEAQASYPMCRRDVSNKSLPPVRRRTSGVDDGA